MKGLLCSSLCLRKRPPPHPELLSDIKSDSS
uniref:Uncharacterized protein n=1 Tax=Anguilla anguilla TaxID=7936 RepID=A0A0E9UJP5_ANGAN